MILEVNGLGFAYNGRPILEDLDFSLEKGRSLGILGVNGAGKSTLLRCLNRILRPRHGSVLVAGRDLAELDGRQVARLMGYVPQSQPPEPLSVFEAVLLGRKPYLRWQAGRRDLEVVARVLEQMRLEHLAQRPVSSLSGGEAQKVMIARALAQEPELLLLDEPTASLDLRNQLEVMELVQAAVRRQGISAVVCLHDINLALRFLDRLLLLKEGRVHALVSPQELTPELIREVYGIEVLLTQVQGYHVVIPLGAPLPSEAGGGIVEPWERKVACHA